MPVAAAKMPVRPGRVAGNSTHRLDRTRGAYYSRRQNQTLGICAVNPAL